MHEIEESIQREKGKEGEKKKSLTPIKYIPQQSTIVKTIVGEKAKLVETRERIRLLTVQVSEAPATDVSKTELAGQLTQLKTAYRAQLEQFRNQTEIQKKQLTSDYAESIKRLQGEMEKGRVASGEKTLQIESLKNQIRALEEAKSTEGVSAVIQNAESIKQIASLKEELTRSTKEYSLLKGEADARLKDYEEISRFSADQQARVHQLENQIAELGLITIDKDSDISKLQDQIGNHLETINDLSQKNQAGIGYVADLQRQITSLSDRASQHEQLEQSRQLETSQLQNQLNSKLNQISTSFINASKSLTAITPDSPMTRENVGKVMEGINNIVSVAEFAGIGKVQLSSVKQYLDKFLTEVELLDKKLVGVVEEKKQLHASLLEKENLLQEQSKESEERYNKSIEERKKLRHEVQNLLITKKNLETQINDQVPLLEDNIKKAQQDIKKESRQKIQLQEELETVKEELGKYQRLSQTSERDIALAFEKSKKSDQKAIQLENTVQEYKKELEMWAKGEKVPALTEKREQILQQIQEVPVSYVAAQAPEVERLLQFENSLKGEKLNNLAEERIKNLPEPKKSFLELTSQFKGDFAEEENLQERTKRKLIDEAYKENEKYLLETPSTDFAVEGSIDATGSFHFMLKKKPPISESQLVLRSRSPPPKKRVLSIAAAPGGEDPNEKAPIPSDDRPKPVVIPKMITTYTGQPIHDPILPPVYDVKEATAYTGAVKENLLESSRFMTAFKKSLLLKEENFIQISDTSKRMANAFHAYVTTHPDVFEQERAIEKEIGKVSTVSRDKAIFERGIEVLARLSDMEAGRDDEFKAAFMAYSHFIASNKDDYERALDGDKMDLNQTISTKKQLVDHLLGPPAFRRSYSKSISFKTRLGDDPKEINSYKDLVNKVKALGDLVEWMEKKNKMERQKEKRRMNDRKPRGISKREVRGLSAKKQTRVTEEQ